MGGNRRGKGEGEGRRRGQTILVGGKEVEWNSSHEDEEGLDEEVHRCESGGYGECPEQSLFPQGEGGKEKGGGQTAPQSMGCEVSLLLS